jgi:hypothetical protein
MRREERGGTPEYNDPNLSQEATPMFQFDNDVVYGFLVFSIPIVAIVGGITVGIVRTLGHQRLAELAARERLAAIERGIDPSKLPPPPTLGDPSDWSDTGRRDPYRRAQGLMIGGLVTLAVGIGLSVLIWTTSDERSGWAVGLIPGLVGVALLLSAWIVMPKNGSRPAG